MSEPQEHNPVQPDSGFEVGRNLPQPFVPLEAPTALQRHRRSGAELPDEEDLSLEHYLTILVRRKWLLLSVTLTVILLAAVQVFTATPIYQATATLQIDPEDENVLPYEGVENPSVVGSRDLEQYLWTQAEKLRSRSLARRVVNKLDLANDEAFIRPVRKGVLSEIPQVARKAARSLFVGPPTDAAEADERKQVSAFLARLDVRPLRNTRLIRVSFDSPDPSLSARITNRLSEEFIEQHLESKFDATTRATVFLERQLEHLQIKVEESEQALLRYAQQQSIVNLSERETISRKRLADLSDELTSAETEMLSKQARYGATRSATLESFPEILKTDAMLTLEQRLSSLEGELAGLSNVYGPQWPRVKTLRSEVAGLEAQLDAQKRQALSSARQEAVLAENQLARLEAAVNQQIALVDRLNEDSIQYNILKRESESNKELYEGLLQRLKQAGVSAGLRSSNIRVADEASVPGFAASPKKLRSLLLASILGLFLGGGLVFVVDTLDNTLKSADDISEMLGLPALGVVPQLEVTGASKRWSLGRLSPRAASETPARAPLLAFGDDRIKGRNRVLEAYRALRTSILLSHSGTPPQVILVTSAVPGEGKSTTAANIATALAQTGARTLLLDCDMRKPMLATLLGISSEKGMSTYLSGNSDLSSQIQKTTFPDLFVVPAGPVAPNPAELLGSKRMSAGLTLVREYFTHVVIDSPPTLEISDAVILSTAVDGVILVARAYKTPRQAVGRGAAQIMAVGGTLLGVLLNGADLGQPSYGYYYGYDRGDYGPYFEDKPKKTA